MVRVVSLVRKDKVDYSYNENKSQKCQKQNSNLMIIWKVDNQKCL